MKDTTLCKGGNISYGAKGSGIQTDRGCKEVLREIAARQISASHSYVVTANNVNAR